MLVEFYRRALVTGRDKPVHPRIAGAIEKIAHGFELVGVEHIRDADQHISFFKTLETLGEGQHGSATATGYGAATV